MSEENEKGENKSKSKAASVIDTAENIHKLRKIVDGENESEESETNSKN
jgi:hypothetical protein